MMKDLVLRTVTTLQCRRGVTAAEYAVLAVGIVVVVGLAAQGLGGRLTTTFNSVLQTSAAPTGGGG